MPEGKMPPTTSQKWLRFDPLLALLSIPIAIFLIFVELQTPKANIPQAVGPEVMPIGILILLVVNAALLFMQSITGKGKAASPVKQETAEPSSESWFKKYQSAIRVLLGLVVYGIILVPAGFILATLLLIIYEARVLQRGRWIRNILVALGFSVGVYLTFVKFLNVMLPAGILG
jgi:putative tricarboxylic transport membrane protein